MKLKKFIDGRGLSASILAKRAGVSPSTVTRIMRGETLPTVPTLIRIVEATNREVTPRELLADITNAILAQIRLIDPSLPDPIKPVTEILDSQTSRQREIADA